MIHDPLAQEILVALDTGDHEVTDWEAGFMESLMRQSFPITAKQRAVLARMAETYLSPELAVKLLGQQRLP